MEEVKSLADKTRRRDLIIDPNVLTQFYETRIPMTVVDRATLERWDKSIGDGKKTIPSPYLTWEDIVLPVDRNEIEEQYPAMVTLGVTKLPLQYRFEPGHEEDGVSFKVPREVVHQLHPERMEWLVPGLLEEKLTYLIKSLPKRLRRQLVPVPDTVQILAPRLREKAESHAPFWKSLCDVLTQHLREPVLPTDFDLGSLPQHLRMRIELLDETGKAIQAGRDLVELQQSQRLAAPVPSSKGSGPAPSYDWMRPKLDTWDIETLPASVVELRGGVRIECYPTVLTDSDSQRTAIVDHALLAEQMLRIGMVRLLHRVERKEIRSQIQHLPQYSASSLWLSDRFPGDKLREVLGDLMARLAFVDTQWHAERLLPVMRTQMEFDLCRVKRIERIGQAASEIGRWLPKLAEANHRVRSLLEKAPGTWGQSVQQIREQLQSLWHESFVWMAPWCVLKEYPRFLASIAIRLERLKSHGSTKDLSIESTANTFWQDYGQRLSMVQPPAATLQSIQNESKSAIGCNQLYASGKLAEYRWAIEELRVSLHSQHLGTRISVSPKRLEKLQSELNS